MLISSGLPRHIPKRARQQVYLRSPLIIIGISACLFGALMMLLANHFANFRSTIQFSDGDPITSGTLLSTTPTGAQLSTGGDSHYVYRHEYTYQVQGAMYKGTSFSRNQRLVSGNAVQVAYVQANPGTSRIKGMGAGVLVRPGLWTAFGANALAAAGLALLFAGLKKAKKHVHLARHGVLTTGKITSKTETSTEINGEQVYDVQFVFTLQDGQFCWSTIRTHKIDELEDQQRERIVYDAFNPTHAVLVDSLPLSLRSLVATRTLP